MYATSGAGAKRSRYPRVELPLTPGGAEIKTHVCATRESSTSAMSFFMI
jgi:hypothetical protein